MNRIFPPEVMAERKAEQNRRFLRARYAAMRQLVDDQPTYYHRLLQAELIRIEETDGPLPGGPR